MKEVYAIQHDTVDAICWREYGRSTGVVERVLEANPHLSEFGPFIPMGTKFNYQTSQLHKIKFKAFSFGIERIYA